MTERYTRLAPTADATVDAASRTASYIFSDESVGRDEHIIKANAWQTANFEKNPVFCWQHLDDIPAIGRVFDLHTVGRTLRGSVKYAETEFADSIYQLVRDGFLNAVSTSWQPITAERRPGGSGLIFTSVDLIEISQVNCPALPSALATARARGLNLAPIAEWADAALERGRYNMPRGELLMLRRAAAGRSVAYSLPTAGGRAQREARARELQEIEGRRRIAARAGSNLPPASRAALEVVQRHHERCEQLHAGLSRQHDDMAEHVAALPGIHRKLARALSEAGLSKDYGVAGAMSDLKRCADNLDNAHDGAVGDVADASDALGLAKTGVADVIDGVPEM